LDALKPIDIYSNSYRFEKIEPQLQATFFSMTSAMTLLI
jgi:hypothetical protein